MKKILAFTLAFAIGAAVGGSLQAQTPAKPTAKPAAKRADAPINIDSDSFQADLNGKTGTWRGNVVLKKGKDVMRGSQLSVNLVTGQATLGGGVKSQNSPGGRVQAIFSPNSGAPKN